MPLLCGIAKFSLHLFYRFVFSFQSIFNIVLQLVSHFFLALLEHSFLVIEKSISGWVLRDSKRASWGQPRQTAVEKVKLTVVPSKLMDNVDGPHPNIALPAHSRGIPLYGAEIWANLLGF